MTRWAAVLVVALSGVASAQSLGVAPRLPESRPLPREAITKPWRTQGYSGYTQFEAFIEVSYAGWAWGPDDRDRYNPFGLLGLGWLNRRTENVRYLYADFEISRFGAAVGLQAALISRRGAHLGPKLAATVDLQGRLGGALALCYVPHLKEISKGVYCLAAQVRDTKDFGATLMVNLTATVPLLDLLGDFRH